MSIELIAKKYRVLKTLGQGAMGEVYLVLPPHGEPVALKLLKTSGEGAHDKAAVEQFENEFKVLKKLSHPNIGKIHDYGYDPDLKKVYFTSPWLKGEDLAAKTKGASYEKIEEYIVQVLRALNYLHQKNIVHCDLKPGNIFVENDQILLIDFGLAGYWGESIVGTPTYLAPEIFKGVRHSVQSDLYAIGVVLYNCLSRTQPFSGKDIQEIYKRHRVHVPVPLHEINPQVPAYMSQIALSLLSKNPEDRFVSASAVIEEISAYSKQNYSVETAETLLSYLPKTSEIIGREDLKYQINDHMGSFLSDEEDANYHGLFIYGDHGVGKGSFANQIKTSLQLEKYLVEEVVLPLSDGDKKVYQEAHCLIFKDVELYYDDWLRKKKGENLVDEKSADLFEEFLSFLEQKVLSPDTDRFYFIVTGNHEDNWKPFENIFPEEELKLLKLEVDAFDEGETKDFLKKITGNDEVPDKFVQEVFRNTGGNPGLCEQLIETLIQKGLLFDQSGRWSADLLSHLDTTLKKMEPPHSLEERLRNEFQGFSPDEIEIVSWLCIAPHGLWGPLMQKVTQWEGEKLTHILFDMTVKKIIRLEPDGSYFLYRSAFYLWLNKNLDQKDLQRRHMRLSKPDVGLADTDRWYHQSFSDENQEVLEALEHNGEYYSSHGLKEKAFECYDRLMHEMKDVDDAKRVVWSIKAADNLIWLDRFKEATVILENIDDELHQRKINIPLAERLLLWEKMGLALLHQHQVKEAGSYFAEGVRFATENKNAKVEEIRFMNDLAQIEVITGHYDRAIPKFKESRRLANKLSSDDRLKITNNDLGYVYYCVKEYEKAVEILNEDIAIFEHLVNQEPMARALYSMAECFRALKNYDAAIPAYEKCIAMCKQENLLAILLRAYNGMGNVYLVNNQIDDALTSYQKAIEISVHLKDDTTKAALLANQGLIYRNNGNQAQAARRFLLAKQILESSDKKMAYEVQLLSKCYNELTAIALNEKDKLKALSYQMERMQMVESIDSLKTETFDVKKSVVELYLDNRLEEPFEKELKKLEDMAETDEHFKIIEEIKSRWEAIQNTENDQTAEVGAEDL